MSRSFVLIFAFFFSIQLISQQKDLPRQLTPSEKMLLESGLYKAPQQKNSFPPEGPLRSMAEWEELQAVVITWTSYRPILANIVDAIKDECTVFIVCNNVESVQDYLTGRGIDWSENVIFKITPFNSVWVRDYGPNPVYKNDVEELILVDWIYNRPRPLDDQVSIAVADELNIPLLSTTSAPEDLVHTGGNFMSDGMGTGFSSELVVDENGPFNNWGTSNHSEEDINQIMNDYMGIERYPKMTNLLYDAIHHIDMHMKILDEETLLVGFYPDGVADGPQINANIEFILSNYKTPFGNDYKIYRMEMPPDFNGQYPDFNGSYRTYTNALFANNTIIVPTYETKYDTTALRIWREIMPGYNIVGINCNAIIPANGALHCITKEIGVSNPLLINMPKTVESCLNEPTDLFSIVKSKSGITTVDLHYRSKGEIEYESTPMVLENEEFSRWTASLVPYSSEQIIEYYVSAENEEGKILNRPFTAPNGYWEFEVKNCSTSAVKDFEDNISELNIFPNPSSSLTCIRLNSETKEPMRLVLYDLLGQEIKEIFSGRLNFGENKYFVEASELKKGYYNISIETNSGIMTRKFMVQ